MPRHQTSIQTKATPDSRYTKILEFLYMRLHEYPPSIREIGETCFISSTSVVDYYLDELEKGGLIERNHNKITRSVKISKVGIDFLKQSNPHTCPQCGGLVLGNENNLLSD